MRTSNQIKDRESRHFVDGWRINFLLIVPSKSKEQSITIEKSSGQEEERMEADNCARLI